MEHKFVLGDIVRPKRAILMQLFKFPISRSEIMTIIDINDGKYAGDDFDSVIVTVKNINGDVLIYSQSNLEKI